MHQKIVLESGLTDNWKNENSAIGSIPIQKHHISYSQDKTLLGGSGKTGKLDDLVRRRRGGRGKPRLSREAKVTVILENLPNSSQMDSKTAYNPGLYMGEIVKLFPSSNWRDIPELVDELCDTNVVTFRKGEKHERPDKFYYRTEEAITVLNKIEEIRSMKEELSSKFHS